MNNKIKISLVLTSQNRIDELDRFIFSLIDQRVDGSIELIYVKQGTYDPFHKLQLPHFIYYKMIEIGHVIPLSVARNIGLQQVTGTVVAFPDDDCWYEPLLIDKIERYFAENPNIACLCTNVFDPLRQKKYGDRPIGLRKKVCFKNLFKLPISVGIFCRVEALDVVGRKFAESLGAGTILGSGEETELIARLLEVGLHIEYNGNIQVYHPVYEYCETDCEKFYRYGVGFGYVNGYLFRRGHVTVLLFVLEMLIRSLVGVVVYVCSSFKRKVYLNRFFGIVMGVVAGMSRRIIV